MKTSKHLQNKSLADVICAPAFPIAGSKLFQRIGAAVCDSRGYTLSNVEFAQLMGRPETTASHWFSVHSHPHVVACFCLLEQLGPAARSRVLDELCRDLPVLDHPRLRHNPAATAALKGLLQQPHGLTVLSGGLDHQRTFVVAALGHSYCRIDPLHRTATGLDVHEPNWFVPGEKLLYLRDTCTPARRAEVVRRLWPDIRSSGDALVLLNGVWSIVPDLRAEILEMASTRHVVVADQDITLAREASPAIGPVHRLSVSSARENPAWLNVDIQRL